MSNDRLAKATFLGTGTSVGVPMVGCHCKVCKSEDTRDKRLRPSLWIRYGEKNLLIDASIDLRLQALTHNIDRLDAILLTHAHADHIFGLDDTRVFSYHQNQSIEIFLSEETFISLKKTFWYAFEETQEGGGKPKLKINIIDNPFTLFGLNIIPFSVIHGKISVTAFRIGKMAYITDAKEIPESGLKVLSGLDILVINALRPSNPHPTHFCLEDALRIVEIINPEKTFLTHMGHDMCHEALLKTLPVGVEPAYDGLEFEF